MGCISIIGFQVFILSSVQRTILWSVPVFKYVFLQANNSAIYLFIVILALFSIHYYFVKDKQTLSLEEERVLFIAHVINSNIASNNRRINKNGKVFNFYVNAFY